MTTETIVDSETGAKHKTPVPPGWALDGSAENAVIVLSRPMTDSEVSGLDDAPITPFAVEWLVCDAEMQWHLRRMVYRDVQGALDAIASEGMSDMVACVRPASDDECRIVAMLTGVVGGSQNEGGYSHEHTA